MTHELNCSSTSTQGVNPAELELADQQQQAQSQGQQQTQKVSESMSFKDLASTSPEGAVQMAAQAGIKINPPPAPINPQMQQLMAPQPQPK